MFDYKMKLQKSRNENRKVLLHRTTHSFCTTVLFHITFKSKCETNKKSCFSAMAGKIHLRSYYIWNGHTTACTS